MARSGAGGAGGGAAHLPAGLDELVSEFREGRGSALARAVSWVEDEKPGFLALLHALTEGAGEPAARIGVTGPPGAGKSTLVSATAEILRSRGEEVGILAVDPTSTHSGGALLGDRIRMNEVGADSGIFIRSMASRGSLGGLGVASQDVLDVMDAFGFPWLLVETVGTGQIESQVADAADTVVVVLVPESGDAVQTMKAGILEIADLFVVNKADLPGAERLAADLRSMLDLRVPPSVNTSGEGTAGEGDGWHPPVLLAESRSGEGIPALLDEVARHRDHLERSGELEERRRRRALGRIRAVLERELKRRADGLLLSAQADAVERVLAGGATSYSIAQELLDRMGIGREPDGRGGDAPGE